jgi:hypothetical protein
MLRITAIRCKGTVGHASAIGPIVEPVITRLAAAVTGLVADDPVAAEGQTARVAAVVSINKIAVVAFLVACGLAPHDAVAASGGAAVAGAIVLVVGIAVVAEL